jgi:putative oxidoreductase
MESGCRDCTSSIGLLILRLSAGGYMLTHGWGKLQMLLAGKLDEFPDPIGLGSAVSLVLVVVAEFGGPVLVMIGFATRFAAVPTVCAMAVAAFVAHANDPWTMGEAAELFKTGAASSWASKEPALLYMIPFLTLIFTGAGKLSLDGLLWPRPRQS